MTRLTALVSTILLLPLMAAAQAPPPVPAAPPLPPAPPAVVVPAIPPVPPMPPTPAMPPMPPMPPMSHELFDLQDHLLNMQDEFRISAEHQRELAAEARDMARIARDEARTQVPRVWNMNLDMHVEPFAFQGPVIVGRAGDDGGLYNNGLNQVQQRQYDRAITTFDRVLAQKSARSDGALYWKAFAQARLVRTEDAITTLTTLRRDFPQSRYLTDAKVLEADVRKMAGQRIDPQTLDANDEIKLLAINGIANTDPDRAIPLLEGVLNATNTLGVKRRALFVLATSTDPRAHQILLRYAKGGGNPELQAEAIRHLASRQDTPARNAELKEIYESTQDIAIRRSIIEAYRNAGDKTALLAIAKGKTEAIELRRSAINGLQNLAAPPELWALYQQETDAELRTQMVNVFGSMGAVEQLIQVAKTEKDPGVRLRAVRILGDQRSEKTGQVLADLYGADQNKDVRKTVISALSNQNNAEGLVAIARKEGDLELKRDIVRRLSDMAPKNKVAADYLMEVIK